MQEITVRLPALLDPRPLVRLMARPLAPRLPTLEGRRLVLVDNGHLRDWEGPNPVVYPTLTQRLQAQYGVAECQRVTRSWGGARHGGAERLAAEIRASGADGVVIALCEVGNAAATLVLAWELEGQGLPTVTICHETAVPVAAAMTASVLPGLPLSQLASQRPSSDPEMMAEILWVSGEIEEGLTRSPDALVAQFQRDFVAAPAAIQDEGTGELTIWASQRHDVEAGGIDLDPSAYAVDFYEAYTDSGFGDGLPMIPPTREQVEMMLRWSDRAPTDRIVPRCFPSGLPLTVGALAIHAVMAGCRPEYFPFLLVAGEGMADAQYRLMQAEIASHSSGHAILMSGPLAEEAGVASQAGCLGPGFRANLTLSRALNLALANVSYPIAQRVFVSTMGSPIQLAFCCAENRQASPWPGFHEDQFEATTTCVTVMRCEHPHYVGSQLSITPEAFLHEMAEVTGALRGHRAGGPADLLVLLNPGHAHLLHAAGWGKPDVERYLFEHASQPQHLRERGEANLERVLIFVVGTDGPHSMIGLSWGGSQAVTKMVTRGDGRPARQLSDFYRF